MSDTALQLGTAFGNNPNEWARQVDAAIQNVQTTTGVEQKQAIGDLFELQNAMGFEMQTARSTSVQLHTESHGNGKSYYTMPWSDHAIGKGDQAKRHEELEVELAQERTIKNVAAYSQVTAQFTADTGLAFDASALVPRWQQLRGQATELPASQALGAMLQLRDEVQSVDAVLPPTYAPSLERAMRDFSQHANVATGMSELNQLRNHAGDIFTELAETQTGILAQAHALMLEIEARPDQMMSSDERLMLSEIESAFEYLRGGGDWSQDDGRVWQLRRFLNRRLQKEGGPGTE